MDVCTSARRLIVSVMVLFVCPLDVLCSWDFLMFKDTTHVGGVLVHQKPASYSGEEHSIHRRSAERDGWLPPYLEFTFDLQGVIILLRLRKNILEDTSAPVFVVHQGQIARDFSTRKNNEERSALYQDIDNGASILLKHRLESSDFDLTGTFVHDGDEFSIQPIRGELTNHVDHRIAKINRNEASLSHDVIDFGSSFLSSPDAADDEATNSTDEWSHDTSSADVSGNAAQLNDDDSNSRVNLMKRVESVSSIGDNIQEFSAPDGKRKSYGVSEAGSSSEKDAVSLDSRLGRDQVIMSRDKHNNTTATTSDERELDGDEKYGDNATEMRSKERVKRQAAGKYVVEMLLVVDYGVYEVWYNGVTDLQDEAKKEETLKRITQYYSFVINGVDLRYKSITRHTDFTMDVTWAGIIIFDTPVPDYWTNTEKPPTASRDFVESSAALEAFRAWADSQGTELPPSDHVMLFTGHNLTYGGSVSNAGLAYLGSACNPDYFYSIVEEYFEFRDVAIAAHELGHSLGARHDMDGNTCLSFDRYIMTSRFKFPSTRKAQNPWLFSSCSVEYFTDFIASLDRNDTNCLVVKDALPNNVDSQPFLVSQPGEVYSGDDFCKIGEGPDSYICRDQHISVYDNICYGGLYCYRPYEKKCLAKLPPNGMSCGNKKWCMNGSCVLSELAPATSDECPFGDNPGLIGGKTCAQRMLTSRYECYRDAFRGKCCASCRRYRRNLPGCEYGDMFELCKKEQCTNYDEEYARDNCCDTCAELFYTIPSTTVTTATTVVTRQTTPQTATTSTGNGKDKGEGHGKSVTTKQGKHGSGQNKGENENETETDNETDETGGGRSERNNKNDVSIRRRNEKESDESDESEYKPRSYFRRRTTRYRTKERRRLNAVTYDRLLQMRSLLNAMKKERDNSRLQRMRFLMYVLDKTGYDVNDGQHRGMSDD